jgi:hypothetical protein
VSQRFGQLDKREKQVVRLWQSGHISPGSILLYLQWVRRYYAYCQLHHLDEAAELTLDGARRFTQAYVGPEPRDEWAPVVVSLRKMRFTGKAHSGPYGPLQPQTSDPNSLAYDFWCAVRRHGFSAGANPARQDRSSR